MRKLLIATLLGIAAAAGAQASGWEPPSLIAEAVAQHGGGHGGGGGGGGGHSSGGHADGGHELDGGHKGRGPHKYGGSRGAGHLDRGGPSSGHTVEDRVFHRPGHDGDDGHEDGAAGPGGEDHLGL